MSLHSLFETGRSCATCQRMFDPLKMRHFTLLQIKRGSGSKGAVFVLVKIDKNYP